MRIETDKRVYHFGEVIRVRITIRNDTGEEYGVHSKVPWLLCNLFVINANGQIIDTSLPREVGPPGGGADVVDLAAGKSYVPSYNLAGDVPGEKHDWTPITAWGYELTYPGTYRIAGIAQLRGLALPGETAPFTTVTASNAVQIKIVT